MEKQLQLVQNGQEIRQARYNDLGEVAAKADDRVLAELLRLAPYTGTVSKAILPYATDGSGSDGLVKRSGAADGSVKVNPFRAIVGSVTVEGTDAVKSWRDLQSAIYTGSATLRQGTVTFAANVSGQNRWDLIQAVVTRDAAGPGETQYVKDPTTLVVSAPSVVPYIRASVTVSIVVGTPAASPVMPAPTADAAGVYYIPLAYVRVPSGFGAASTVAAADIAMCAPQVAPSRGGGAPRIIIPNQSNVAGGTVLTSAQQTAWGNSGAARPETFMPSSLFGGETLFVQASVISGANFSHNVIGLGADSVIDSRDWRGRHFLTFIQVEGTNGKFPQANDTSMGGLGCQQITDSGDSKAISAKQNFALGQSITFGTLGRAFVGYWLPATLSSITAGADLAIVVDNNDGGKLKVYSPTGNWPGVKFTAWIMSIGVHASPY